MPKIIDLTGQRFGKLVVLEKDSLSGPSNQIKWICQCDCGNKKSIIGSNLRNGLTQSCGCLQKEKTSNNLIGQRFGKLIVLEKTEKRTKNRCIIWKCKCDCGNICEVSTKNLTQCYTSSCGCVRASNGELKISQILLENHIPFETEKTFQNCRSYKNHLLRFDFYVENKYIIEFDGIHHIQSLNFGNYNEEHFKEIQINDKIKNKWCKENNIPLIRIPYKKLKTLCLNDLLLETSKFIV